jgi:hypothetical protein
VRPSSTLLETPRRAPRQSLTRKVPDEPLEPMFLDPVLGFEHKSLFLLIMKLKTCIMIMELEKEPVAFANMCETFF